ncbi:MAG: DUF4149 domain-containing protein [Elsteraceae bacterium]
MHTALATTAMLLSSLLFGGMVLFSFGFALFVLKHLPAAVARPLIRQAFPHYYLLVIVTAGLAALAAAPLDRVTASLLAAIALSTLLARQVLMPAVNAATDQGDKRRFGQLHGISVLIQLAQIGAVVICLLRF